MSATSSIRLPFLGTRREDSQEVRGWCGERMVHWLKASASFATTGLSIAARVANFHPATNALSTIGIGIGLQSLVQTCIPERYSSRVQQAATTVFGQTPLFLLSGLWATFPATQTATLATIGVMLGVNLAVHGKLLMNTSFALQSDTDRPEDPDEQNRNRIDQNAFWPIKTDFYFKATASAVSLVGWLFASRVISDPVIKGITSFLSLYYLSEPCTEYLCELIDAKISKKDEFPSQTPKTVADLRPSGWRQFQTIFNTVGYIAIPLSWVPWKGDPRTTERETQMWIVGLVVGFFEGFVYRTQQIRFKKYPIQELEELQPRTPPQTTAFKAGRVGWSAIIHLSMASFVISQLVTQKNEDKIAIGTMYFGYFFTSLKNMMVDEVWDPDRRHELAPRWRKFWDQRVVGQILPRTFAINPVYIYMLLTNSIAMHSGQQMNTMHKVLNCVSWYFYGNAMANEHQQTWGERKGTVFTFPKMFTANALLTLVPMIKALWETQNEN